MKTMMRDVLRVILIPAVAACCGFGQEAAPEKHVWEIKTEQPREVILASPLCQRVRAKPNSAGTHERRVDAATLETDLSSLMAKSDEVVLASEHDDTLAISPSGEDAVRYADVVIFRIWKGSHKVGDTLTIGVPGGAISCYSEPYERDQDFAISSSSQVRPYFYTDMVPPGKLYNPGNTAFFFGPTVLFLRHSRGNETQLVEGLRLTGGDGTQGMYGVSFSPTSKEYRSCDGRAVAAPGKQRDFSHCNEILGATQLPIIFGSNFDPLYKKYDGMPFSSFIEKVQSVADLLGSSATPVVSTLGSSPGVKASSN
jgi:hypothetical protein